MVAPVDNHMNAPLAAVDPEVARILEGELGRQRNGLEMIASENFVPRAVMQAQGSVLTNKYAEGYPGRRYYGGCEWVDRVERLAIERAKALYGATYANVQPHSGAQANEAIYGAFMKPGETVMGLALDQGGHLTHGMKLNYSGRIFNAVAYGLNRQTYRIDMDEVAKMARLYHPKMIIAGWSAYPRHLDFAAFRQIADEVGAVLWTDMAHFAGLVAAGLHPNPVSYSDVVTTTIHKTLGGPRSGMILSRDADKYAKVLNRAVFPGLQGGPLEHVIAAKAVALGLASGEDFRERQQRTLEGAQILAQRLLEPDVKEAGITLVTGGTDVHLVLVDLRHADLNGREAENLLASIGITVNRNAVPWDPRPAMVTSGLRIGTPALATRGFGEAEFEEVADIIATALVAGQQADVDALSARVRALTEAFPLYEGLDQTGAREVTTAGSSAADFSAVTTPMPAPGAIAGASEGSARTKEEN
ncbi:serine hydroxymethyltransferase [Neoactinobaculum massilliense]|uniref:serine hydroxymethyltransferase n=1 Tax=Neoactinobaculum massilliense TaxID=2364794 RepID=UPI003B969067